MKEKQLYHIQSATDSMYVVATGWQNAIRKWKNKLMKDHNDFQNTRQISRLKKYEDIEEPDGIEFVSDNDKLLL